MVRTLQFTAEGPSSIPGWGTKIPQGMGMAKKEKKNNLRCKKKSINKLECIHTMDYCSGVRRIELLIHVTV